MATTKRRSGRRGRAKRAAAGAARGHGHRPIWNGHLVFGLVSMPVRVLAALDASEHVGFRLLHRKDHAPITYKKFCSREDVEVPADEIVRGYEVGKRTKEYALVEGEELEQVQEELGEGQHTIDVLQFVEPASLDPLLFERPYYVVPDEGGSKAYALLRDAMRESGRFAVARLYLRRPVLAAIMPHGDVLALEVMRPFDELRATDRLDVPAAKASEAERRMARKLIDEMAAEWDPRAHPNRYRVTLEKLLAGRKRFPLAEGGAAGEAEDEGKPEGKVVDLMEALRRSLGSSHARRARPAARPRSTRRAESAHPAQARPRPRARKAGGGAPPR
jgi:DNA end-binding protein Ku